MSGIEPIIAAGVSAFLAYLETAIIHHKCVNCQNEFFFTLHETQIECGHCHFTYRLERTEKEARLITNTPADGEHCLCGCILTLKKKGEYILKCPRVGCGRRFYVNTAMNPHRLTPITTQAKRKWISIFQNPSEIKGKG